MTDADKSTQLEICSIITVLNSSGPPHHYTSTHPIGRSLIFNFKVQTIWTFYFYGLYLHIGAIIFLNAIDWSLKAIFEHHYLDSYQKYKSPRKIKTSYSFYNKVVSFGLFSL